MERKKIADSLLLYYKVASLAFYPAIAMVPFGIGSKTMLVVDLGQTETRVVPVFEKSFMRSLYASAPLGMDSITTEVAKCLPELQVEELEDIVVRCCFVPKGDLDQAEDIVDTKYTSKDATIMVEKRNRMLPGKVLFEGPISIASIILDVVASAPLDIRKALIQNIALVGGVSMMPGFKYRLKNEMVRLCKERVAYADLIAAVQSGVHVIQTKVPSNMLSWVGGSVFAASTINLEKSDSAYQTTREAYEKNQKLPDWMRIVP